MKYEQFYMFWTTQDKLQNQKIQVCSSIGEFWRVTIIYHVKFLFEQPAQAKEKGK